MRDEGCALSPGEYDPRTIASAAPKPCSNYEQSAPTTVSTHILPLDTWTKSGGVESPPSKGKTEMGNGDPEPTKLKDTEPVAVWSAITNSIKTLTLALLALALAFGWVNWSNQQNAAVVGVVAAVFVIISALSSALVRQKVTPINNARAADGTPLVKK